MLQIEADDSSVPSCRSSLVRVIGRTIAATRRRRSVVQHERWVRLEQLFADALALPADARAAYLLRHCSDDADLRGEVEELLRAHDAPGALDALPYSPKTPVLQPSLAAGTCLGPWRIEKLVGRGGMGEVYAAVRADGAFEQRVALKLLRYEAAGQMERFHAERRILARLEHSEIARLLDGGIRCTASRPSAVSPADGCGLNTPDANTEARLYDNCITRTPRARK